MITNRNGPHNVRPYNHSRLIKVPMTACRPTRNHYNHNHKPSTKATKFLRQILWSKAEW